MSIFTALCKKTVFCVHWQKHSTASLKKSTDVSAQSTRFFLLWHLHHCYVHFEQMCEVEGEVPTKAVIDPPLSTPLPSKTLNTLLSSKYPAPQKTQHSTSLSLKTLNFPKKKQCPWHPLKHPQYLAPKHPQCPPIHPTFLPYHLLETSFLVQSMSPRASP